MENYARFYASFNELPYSGDRDEFKKDIVAQFTWNRTTSLKEMTKEEYNACCNALEKMSGRKDKIKKERSSCLKLMQKLGVNTSDWPTVDNFCMNPRIAGKRFSHISLEELIALQKKLRAIERKGGFGRKPKEPDADASGTVAGHEGGVTIRPVAASQILVYIPNVQGEA